MVIPIHLCLLVGFVDITNLLSFFSPTMVEHSIEFVSLLNLIPFLVPNSPSKTYLEQAMVGLLLGDGSLVKKYVGGGTYFKFAQSTIHSGYLQHVFNIFNAGGHLIMSAPSQGKSVVKGVTYYWAQFSTRSLTSWNVLHAYWYVDGVKVIPSNMDVLLTPIALAYWFMDDGGWTNDGIHMATNSFTKEDVLRLIGVLQSKYGLKCSMHSRNRIFIWKRSCPDFINIVKPYMHSDMAYKLAPRKQVSS